MYPPPHMYPPAHIYWQAEDVVAGSRADDTGASYFQTLGCHSCDSCMYPLPQMTCMYPPPHMTIPALLISKPLDAIPVIHVCILLLK